MEDKRYNFRSKKTEYTIPIQLQLASDEDFMDALRPSASGQVFESEHTDSSDSDIDISDLINHSDQNLSDPVIRSEVFPGKGQGPVNQHVSGENSVSQNDINRQIWQQLNSLGDRFAAIENTTKPRPHKKTSDTNQLCKASTMNCHIELKSLCMDCFSWKVHSVSLSKCWPVEKLNPLS